jgi:hypothetical protein
VRWITGVFAIGLFSAGCQPQSETADAMVHPDAATLSDIDAGPLYQEITFTKSSLDFVIIGDTRPAMEDQTSMYPTIINTIFASVEHESPHPDFAVTTGDYMFASTTGSEQVSQLSKYLIARNQFTGLEFPAMGNHECTGATASNCGPALGDGITKNMDAFRRMMLWPIQIGWPNYVVNINATDSSWTAKFVFVAGNSWDTSATPIWLDTALAKSTTYTFVIRHEATTGTGPDAPGEGPSQTIITSHPYTMLICGHTHTYDHSAQKEMIVGNGGAPVTGTVPNGYVVVQRNASGTITFTPKKYDGSALGTSASYQPFTVKADGSPG